MHFKYQSTLYILTEKKMVSPKVSLKAALMRSVRDLSSTILRLLVHVSSSLSANSFSRSTFGIRPNLTAEEENGNHVRTCRSTVT